MVAKFSTAKPLIPDKLQSIAQNITNIEGGFSQEVGWYIGEETEDQPFIVYGLLALIIIGGSALFSLRASTKDNSYGDVKEYSRTSENATKDPDVDANASSDNLETS